MPFDTARIITTGNLKVFMKYPSVIFRLGGGKISAYAYILERVFAQLQCSALSQIERCLNQSIDEGHIVFPRELSVFDGSYDLSNIIMLYYLTKVHRPENVVETGVWTGKTSWAILRALGENYEGRLYSIDLGTKDIDGQRLPVAEIGGLIPQELRSLWTLLIGDSKDILPKVVFDLSHVDLFYHDSNHAYEHMTFEFETVWKRLRTGGLLCSDDTDRNSAFQDFSRRCDRPYHQIGNRFGLLIK